MADCQAHQKQNSPKYSIFGVFIHLKDVAVCKLCNNTKTREKYNTTSQELLGSLPYSKGPDLQLHPAVVLPILK